MKKSKSLFCFYKHVFKRLSFSITDQGWLQWTSLWVFVFKNAICPWLCFSNFGNDSWNRLTKCTGYLCVLLVWFRASNLSNLSEGILFCLLRMSSRSRDKACFEIFNSLFNVNFTIKYTQAGEFIGSFHHIIRCYSNKKNFHFLHINVIPFAIEQRRKTLAHVYWTAFQ